jgi:hypothetical protein
MSSELSYPEQLPLLAGLLPQIFTPVQVITGRDEPLVPVGDDRPRRDRAPACRCFSLTT